MKRILRTALIVTLVLVGVLGVLAVVARLYLTSQHVADQVAFMETGELVAVAAPDRILHQPEDPRIQSFLRTYHERNAF